MDALDFILNIIMHGRSDLNQQSLDYFSLAQWNRVLIYNLKAKSMLPQLYYTTDEKFFTNTDIYICDNM